jgi:tetratricopeptide (TPR) repeat protein
MIISLQKIGKLDQAEQCCTEALTEAPTHPDLMAIHAALAKSRGDLAESARRWSLLEQCDPNRRDAIIERAKCLRDLGEHAAAEQLLKDAMALQPDVESFLTEYAWLAHIRRDWPEAIKRWELVRLRWPRLPVGFISGAIGLRESGRAEEAESLLSEALSTFPDHLDLMTERAYLAQTRHDWTSATERWLALRRAHPDRAIGYTAGANALRMIGAANEADSLLSEAAQRFPQQAELAISLAQKHAQTSDWLAAARAWEEIRSRFPTLIQGWIGSAQALRMLDRTGEADEVLREAQVRFPNDPTALFEFAWRAHHSRDWLEALQRWDIVRSRHPDNPASYIGGAVSRRELGRPDEADALLQEAMQRFPDHAACTLEYAWVRHACRDWQAALPRWVDACTKFPTQPEAWLRRAIAEIELWQFDAAEATLAQAVDRFPDHLPLASVYADSAVRVANWPLAQERYATIRKRFPGDLTGFIGGASVLRTQFRLTEAEDLLNEAVTSFPDDPKPRLELALLPIAPLFRKDRHYDIAFQRLAELRHDFPSFPDAFITSVAMLRELEQYESADRIAQSWTGVPPIGLALEQARVAEARGDLETAITRFTDVCSRFPTMAAGHVGLASALSRSGRHDDADAIISSAMARFPSDPRTALEYGQVAARRHDWTNALARWTSLQARFPDNQEFSQRIYEAQTRLSELEPDSDFTPPVIDRSGPFKAEIDLSVSADIRQQMRELAMQFESLGGRDIGCEFGMVQRACGAEPLGLLRWADMPPDKLITALENRFSGVGEVEFTELFIDGLQRPEYCTRDRRGMMYSRAFIYADEIPFDKMYTQSCRRLKFLTRKLIDDLEIGSKIFVYRLSRRNLNDDELFRLHAAVRSYGNNTLLYVRYTDTEHHSNTVEIAAPGLLIGYMDKFKVSQTGQLDAVPPTDAWMTVCRAAYELWPQAQPPA